MNAFGKTNQEIWVGVGLSTGITLTMMLIYGLGGFQWLEQHTYDMRMNLRGSQSVETPILLVLNDEQTLNHLGVAPSRVSRTHYAQAISHLHQAKARLIVLDVIFSDAGNTEEDTMLAEAIRQASNVVLARYIGQAQTTAPLPLFRKAARGEGLINVRPDADGVLRGMPFLGVGYADEQLRPFLTLGAEVARLYKDPEGTASLDINVPGLARLGSIAIPVEHNTTLINFTGPPGTFPALPFWQIVQGQFSPEQIEDQIVLMGSSAATLQDFHLTPFTQKESHTLNAQPATVTGTRMPGVEVHANLLNMILANQFMVRSPDRLIWFLIGAMGLTCFFLITLIPQGEMGVILGVVGLLGIIIGVSIALFNTQNYWLDTVPLIAVVNGHFALATAYQRYLVVRQRNRLKAQLDRTISQADQGTKNGPLLS